MDLIKLLPLILQLMSRGGDVEAVVKLATELLARIQGLLPAPTQALPDVTNAGGLQSSLKILGFDPGPIDGDYGPKTKAAVKAFQHWWNGGHPDAQLLEDGWAGARTLPALAQALREKM